MTRPPDYVPVFFVLFPFILGFGNILGFDHYYGLLHNLDFFETVHYDDEGGIPIICDGEVVERPADPAKLTRMYTD